MGRTRTVSLVVILLGLAGTTRAQLPDCDGVSPVDNTGLKTVTVASGLASGPPPRGPLFVTAPPGDADRLFIVQQDGRIWIKERGNDPADLTLFMDIRDRVFTADGNNEAGLLGLAFDPDFDNNSFFYVNYFAGTGSPTCTSTCRTVVSRFSVSDADPNAGDPGSELELMVFPQPQNNHNGGQVFFGPLVTEDPPRAFLFIATGDGGGAADDDAGHAACGNGQSLETLLGKILRIDVSGIDPNGTSPDMTCMSGFAGASYTVPSDNPFVDGLGGNCNETWAYGLRNPWSNAFDDATGDFFTADVGQRCYEEVNFVEAADAPGRNYGWRQMEGNHCFNHNRPANCNASNTSCAGSPDCNDPSLTDPIVEYSHSDPGSPCSITGGFVYRGCRMPNFLGTYFYGDFCSGSIWSLEVLDGLPTNQRDWTSQLAPGGLLANALTGFGTDALGEHYIADRNGSVLKIMPPFTEFQVSGPGAAGSFLLGQDGNWTWEDLEFSSMHPVEYYQIYRGVPNGTFQCIHSTTETTWVLGDTDDPAPGDLQAYVVTAVSGGEETSSGTPERNLTNPCGPPA